MSRHMDAAATLANNRFADASIASTSKLTLVQADRHGCVIGDAMGVVIALSSCGKATQ